MEFEKLLDKILGEDAKYNSEHADNVNKFCICMNCNRAWGWNRRGEIIRRNLKDLLQKMNESETKTKIE